MEEIDYAKLIPAPPADLVKWLKNRGCFCTHYLIYRCGWEREIMTGIKTKCLDVTCSACGAHFKAARNEDLPSECGHGWLSGRSRCSGTAAGPAGDAEIVDGEYTSCPVCGARVLCRHIGSVGNGLFDAQWPLVLSKSGKNLIAAGYRVLRSVGKDGAEKYQVSKYEAYVFTSEKAYRYAAWHSGGFGNTSFINWWEPRKRCTDYFGRTKHLYYAQKNVFCGTAYENCKLYRYLRTDAGAYPISYLLLFRRRPQVENLLVQGYETLVKEAVSARKEQYTGYVAEAINWKEKSPRKMLGLSKPDFNALKNKQLSSREIVNFRKIRSKNRSQPPEDICNITQTFGACVNDLAEHGKDCVKIARYCTRQAAKSHGREKQTPSGMYMAWSDYIRMAQKLEYNLKDDSVKFPPRLRAAHDRAVMAAKFQESEALKEKFSAMHQRLIPYTWEEDGLLIRPAATEEELIKEGKILHHCVGGYGKTHCGGRPIFFIRRANDPETPYYTLNLDLTGKYIIQIHGYRNDALEPVPEKVKEFANLWLKKVVKTAPAQRGAKKKKATAA